MKIYSGPNQSVQKMRIPARIVYIFLPLFCLSLIALRFSGCWLTKPWLIGVIVFYYAAAAAYLILVFVIRMRVFEIVGLFLLLALSLLMWVPYHWILALLLVPALFMAFYRRGNKIAAIIVTSVIGCIVLLITVFSAFIGFIDDPDKYEYYTSPDYRYVMLEHAIFTLPSGTSVTLYRSYGPLLVEKRLLYLANNSDFGKKIEWLDDRTILIYGEKMDVFKDPTIENYDPF